MTRKNHRKERFLSSLPTTDFTSSGNPIAKKCKFNFAYFDASQDAGQSFSDWTKEQICKLLEKLKYYSAEPLEHWRNQKIGGGSGRVLAIYDEFPKRSAFSHPAYVPSSARWARFRLEGDMRLIGFLITDELHNTVCQHCKMMFDKNTFYIVFLDNKHQFYLMGKK